jgi:hypothetical protein
MNTRNVKAEVFAIIPEYRLVYCREDSGFQYVINSNTPGVVWSQLKAGDIISMTVFTNISKVKEVLNVFKG